MNKTVLDNLLSNHPVTCKVQPVMVAPDEIVHVVGAQEPVRDQPDERARMLLNAGWLQIEHIRTDLSESERSNLVAALQKAARVWMKESAGDGSPSDREQVRWLVEKTRSRESKQQIAQRVWLAVILYGLGCRGLAFDSEGQTHWEGGVTGRIGLSPDMSLDLAWPQDGHQIYAASFRRPDGTITRGKGRRRWHIYRLTIEPAAGFLFERRTKQVKETVALIVASETYATQPQLPRDFYGGNAFQQACIDAEDQQFTHIVVLSPEHGIVSLDDVVPSDQSWGDIMERRIWAWQLLAVRRLGAYLFGKPGIPVPEPQDVNWWTWLNPESTYECTIFGGGFIVRVLIEHLIRSRARAPHNWPEIVVSDWRPGYDVGEFDNDFGSEFEMSEDFADEPDFEAVLQDIDQLLEWATEFVSLVTIFVPPIGETWELAPDEALIPIRLLAEMGMSIEDLLDLLTDVTLLLEQPLPFSMLINPSMVVSALLQITHGLVHDEREGIQELLDVFPAGVLRQYIESALQEPAREDQLCACLTLAEQVQLLALTISPAISDQLMIWLQTHLSSRLRQRVLGESGDQQ